MSLPALVPLDKLKPAPWNPRLITSERFKNLCQSIEADPEFFRLRPILAQADGTIYAGNQRYRAAQHLGLTEAWAVIENVPGRLAKERALRDNHQWGEWQEDELAELMASLHEQGSALDTLGFDHDEALRLLSLTCVGEAEDDPFQNFPIPPDETHVEFRFGTVSGRVSNEVYGRFTDAYNARQSQGVVSLDTVLSEWLASI